ncbi:hypothetical protein ACWD4G_29220 [Streptomyces sp. NPDC002643]
MTELVAEHQRITDRAETRIINTARNDAAYALTMVKRPEVSGEGRNLARGLDQR